MQEKKEWFSRGYIPHRDKLHLLQSITFRLADSLPQKKLKEIEKELEQYDMNKQEIQRRIKIEEWLDSGMGCCALKHPKVAEVMQNALFFFDDEKYKLIAWCIMPNHVHVLIEPYIPLSKIIQSWKAFTGKWALQHNEELGLGIKNNVFWLREYWDRFIRDKKHYDNVVEYINNNPVKAGLCANKEEWKWSSCGYDYEL